MTLIFVYNAKSGAIHALLDSAHKILHPKTYNCNLCELTHGVFTEKLLWKEFRESSGIAMKFLHSDEFLKAYRSKWLPKYEFPIILSEEEQGLQVFINTDVLNAIETTSALITEIENSLS